VAANPKSQKEENATTNEISGSALVLGDSGRGALVERAGVRFLRDPHFRPGSNDGIHDGGSKAMGSIHPRLDLFRLRPGRFNRGGGKHWPIHAKGLDYRDVRNQPFGSDCPDGLHHDHCRRVAGYGTIGSSHALANRCLCSGPAVVLVVRQESELALTG